MAVEPWGRGFVFLPVIAVPAVGRRANPLSIIALLRRSLFLSISSPGESVVRGIRGIASHRGW